jgi:ADP-ribose pyrophosphatase YjhB (NUDIX family)
MKAPTKRDKALIDAYRKTLGKYPKPSVTADIIAVRPAYSELKSDQWRENPEFALEMLFIKRGQWPFEGSWALPGGFIRPTETVEEGARRELREETALVSDRLIPVGVFSKPDRDMRAWIISNAFVSFHKRGEGVHVKGGDDASEAKWLVVRSPAVGEGRFKLPFYDGDKLEFCISGTYREEEFGGGTVLSVGDSPLAFDHAEIIAQAFLRMLSFDIKKLVFFFLPEKFTLSNYIDIYQYLTRYSIEPSNIPNFRRQLTATKDPLLEVCEGEMETLDGRAHAPAKLYRRRSG